MSACQQLLWVTPTTEEYCFGYQRVAVVIDEDGSQRRIGFNDSMQYAEVVHQATLENV